MAKTAMGFDSAVLSAHRRSTEVQEKQFPLVRPETRGILVVSINQLAQPRMCRSRTEALRPAQEAAPVIQEKQLSSCRAWVFVSYALGATPPVWTDAATPTAPILQETRMPLVEPILRNVGFLLTAPSGRCEERR